MTSRLANVSERSGSGSNRCGMGNILCGMRTMPHTPVRERSSDVGGPARSTPFPREITRYSRSDPGSPLAHRSAVFSGLRARIVLIAAIAILPAMALITYAQKVARDEAREKTIEDNLRLARLAASDEAGVLLGAQRVMLTLSHVPDIPDSLEECAVIFRRIAEDHPGFMNVAVIDRAGSVVCSSAPAGLPVGDREWFQQAMRTRSTTVSNPQISRTSGAPDIVVAQPILNKDGAVRYVMAVGIDARRFGDIAATIPLTKGTTVTLFDRTRTIVTR